MGAGFPGSHPYEGLVADGHEVICLDDQRTDRWAASPNWATQPTVGLREGLARTISWTR
jgi:hypothetical protein